MSHSSCILKMLKILFTFAFINYETSRYLSAQAYSAHYRNKIISSTLYFSTSDMLSNPMFEVLFKTCIGLVYTLSVVLITLQSISHLDISQSNLNTLEINQSEFWGQLCI